MDRKTALKRMCDGVKEIDKDIMQASRDHWDQIAKPLDGLGVFEKIISRIAAVQGQVMPVISRRAVVIMCGDNGVVEEGVTQTGSHVTALVTENFAKGTASVSRMARQAGADVIPVDMGINGEIREFGVQNCKLGYGTGNIRVEPAMTEEQALEGILTGIRIAGQLKDGGYHLLAAGEMGIGNTTTAGAVASVLLGCAPEQTAGAGAGLSKEGIHRKRKVICEAIQRSRPDSEDAVRVLAELGGFDLVGLAGLFLGGAIYQIPVVVDGMIAATAALAAARICPAASEYMIASHMGKEPAHRLLMEALGLTPVIYGNMALGEGTGAVLLFPLLDMAYQVYQEPTTFDSIHIPAYRHFNGGKEFV